MGEAVTHAVVHEMWRELVEPAGWTVCASDFRPGLGVAGITRNGVGLVLVLHNSVLTVVDAATYQEGGEALITTSVAEASGWGSAGLYERLEMAAAAAKLARTA